MPDTSDEDDLALTAEDLGRMMETGEPIEMNGYPAYHSITVEAPSAATINPQVTTFGGVVETVSAGFYGAVVSRSTAALTS